MDSLRKEVGRGKREKPNLGFWLLAVHHQGNCVVMATSKPAPHLPSTPSAAVTSTPARHFRIGGCGPPETAKEHGITAAVANQIGSVARDAKEGSGVL